MLRVGPSPDGKGARDVTVVPVDDEGKLRRLAWIEDNRRKVDELTQGRLAYVYLPDTGGSGYTTFNRYFFAQVGKEGVVIDERFNGGGLLADYIIDYLRRPLMSNAVTREGSTFAFAGGDLRAEGDDHQRVGRARAATRCRGTSARPGSAPLVGTRTWGGLVGIGGYPPLIDGGTVTAPRVALYGLEGEWEVENDGIAPDVEVELDPAGWRAGPRPAAREGHRDRARGARRRTRCP